ncbi:MAG: hypothetical protein OEW68_02690 [Gammaproteobacteria bacterium]|nr:hypothetical protein [Gammaproteobacteria bacterium]MDH4313733.1 hypothetical protein [Gammaproteobacteria bacterium]MDH5212977.1 hypothetical protein [Gammaproteobacteria bacterium]MDH5500405.1 hypothetical protein [Gammaproteobacteria bacterium]
MLKNLDSRSAFMGMLILLLLLALVAPVEAGSVNKSVKIEDGARSSGESSVNGSITVGSGAIVDGSLETVNGAIRVGDDSTVRDLDTVNGSIQVGSNATTGDINGVNGSIRLGKAVVVDGEISVVNGKISVDEGSKVAQDVGNVNGEFEILGSEIGGDLSTVNGDVLVADGSVIKGDLRVEKPSGWGWKNQRKPRVVIGPESTVEGKVHLEREVELYIHDSASVGSVSGVMSMEDAVRFSGNRP